MKIVLWILSIILVLASAYFLIPGVFSLFVNPKKKYESDSKTYRFLLNTASAIGLWFMRVKVTVSGVEKLPKNEKLLFVGNHRSNFDPIITWYALRDWRISYVSKSGNFKLPIFGRIIGRCCFLSIDRENPRKAVEAVNRAADLLKAQEVSVGVYPEGTRSRDGELLPFHNGVFRIAQRADVPVAVVVLKGTETIRKNYPFRRSNVELTVAEVIPAHRVRTMRSAELGERVRKTIEDCLKQDND